MFINTNAFLITDDDANYDENDAVWKDEEKDELKELDEFGFKAVEEEEVEEKEKKEVKDEDDEEDGDKKDGSVIEGFGLEKDV